jgi:hypothetical protein
MHQMSLWELPLEGRGEAPRVERSGEAGRAAQGKERSGSHDLLMERVVARENALEALKRVRRNKGSPGIDGMTVEELEPYLREHWQTIREQLLTGSYRPSAVRRKQIPKSGGGVRELGIPTVLDRFVQQLFLQVLTPIFDPTFSEHSHGFRPGRRAHDAVREAQQYIQDGRRWVVDVDLEKFFDRVNHDVLMGKLENRIGDRRMLRSRDHRLPPIPIRGPRSGALDQPREGGDLAHEASVESELPAMIAFMLDPVVEPGEAGSVLAVEAPDPLEHGHFTGVPDPGLAGRPRVPQHGQQVRPGRVGRDGTCMLPDMFGVRLSGEVAIGPHQLPGHHVARLHDVHHQLGHAPARLRGSEIHAVRGDRLQLGDHTGARVAPRLQQLLEQRIRACHGVVPGLKWSYTSRATRATR